MMRRKGTQNAKRAGKEKKSITRDTPNDARNRGNVSGAVLKPLTVFIARDARRYTVKRTQREERFYGDAVFARCAGKTSRLMGGKYAKIACKKTQNANGR